MKNFKFGKRFFAGIVAVSIIGSSIGAYHIYKKQEVNRVKNYLEDFLTEDNYVDLSKIGMDYDIRGFSGESLEKALMEVDARYVRLTDSYIYDGSHVVPFVQKSAFNYDNVLGIDDNGNTVYEGYEPIRVPSDNGVIYQFPEGFTLEDISVLAEPIRYNELDSKKIVVYNNDYEESRSLSLRNK